MKSTRKCVKRYFISSFTIFIFVITLFFVEAANADSVENIEKTVFGKLWVFVLIGLALNLIFSLVFFLKFKSGIYSKLETLEKAFEKDSITNLYSFKNFLKQLPNKLEEYHESGDTGAIVIVSMDDFKKINSIGGYEAGNEVLLTFSSSLKSFVRESELIARYFGDEIIMLLRGTDQDNLKERIISIWKHSPKYIEVDKIEYIIRVSMGVKMMNDLRSDSDKVINRATIAKVKAKQNGGDCCEFYTDETDYNLKIEAEIENSLYHALDNHEFYLLYQPIVDVENHEITANEALLRWNNEKFKDIPILDVIKIAEKKGIIREIGEWVIYEACMQNKAWQDSGLGNMVVSVNVSALQMDQPNFIDVVKKALDKSGLMPQYLQLEITETIAMEDVKSKLQLIRELKQMGVNISVDDFGTGYSSLSYFTKLPIDNLKIDKSFTKDMNRDANSKMVINTIINMAKGMSITTTAEGVEEYDQASMLKYMGCNKIQGYLVTKPLKPEMLETLIMKLPIKEDENIAIKNQNID